MKKRFTEEQIIGFLRESEAGMAVKELCRRHFRNECLNEHWFPSLLHARTEIETWRRKYNEGQPKRALGGLTFAAYAKQLKLTPHSNSTRY